MDIKIEYFGKLIVVRLDGEFYIESIRQADSMWEEQVKKKPEIIAIDCNKLEFIDSSAIGTLVKFLNNSAEYNIKMIFFDLSDAIVKIFEKAKLNRVFPIITQEEFERDYMSKFNKEN